MCIHNDISLILPSPIPNTTKCPWTEELAESGT
jgi:hypothetical protein